jgi:hypothetical protein
LNSLSEAQARGGGEAYFLVVDNGIGNVSECVGNEEMEENTSFGKISYLEENGDISLYIGDDETNYLIDQQKDGDAPDVQILVFDNTNGELVDTADFELNAIKK